MTACSNGPFAVVPREEIFRETGIQFMQLNSLYQLHAMKLAGAPALNTAAKLLFMPDLLNYWLTGVAKAELTIASTSQFYNPVWKQWCDRVCSRAGTAAIDSARNRRAGHPARHAAARGRRIYADSRPPRPSMPRLATTPRRQSRRFPPKAPTGATSALAHGR